MGCTGDGAAQRVVGKRRIRSGASDMRILYAAQKHDYGDPQRGYSFEHYNFYNTLVNMNDKEHEIIYFPYDELITSLGPGAMNREFERLVDERQPEVVFIVLFTNEFEPATVRRISARRSTVTVAWMSDDHWRFENYGRHWAPAFNWVTTTDSRAVSKYHAAGYENAIKTQWACNHFLYKPTPSENGPYADLGVTFVGQPHGDRKQLIRAFLEVGISVACWGRGWPDGRVDQGDMLKVFANSKINLNLSNSSGGLSVKNIAKIFMIYKKTLDYMMVRRPFLQVLLQ